MTTTWKRETFTIGKPSYQLAQAPANPAVFLNGLLMAPGVDYTLAGNTVTFTGSQPDAAAIVQVLY